MTTWPREWREQAPADPSKTVEFAADAYTTGYDDLKRLLDATTGATDKTITLLSASSAGEGAIQQIRKEDAAAGRVIIKAGGIIVALLVDQNEIGAFRSIGGTWRPIRYRGRTGIIAHGSTQLAVGAVTVETVIATIPIPAGLIGPKGIVELDLIWSLTNNANAKTGRVRLGGLAGSSVGFLTLTSFASARSLHKFYNRNAEDSQVYFGGGSGVGTSGTALGTAAVNTAVAQDLVITGTKANAADLLALEAYEVRLVA
jgi:hypothetical protein